MNNFSKDLQKKIIEEFKLRIKQSISKDEFYKIYNRAKELYETKTQEKFLPPKEFAIEYLQLTISTYKKVNGGNGKVKILRNYEVEEIQIKELRKNIINNEKLHIGDFKSYRKLLEYYNKYFIPLMEKDFYEKVLDVDNFSLRNIKPKKL